MNKIALLSLLLLVAFVSKAQQEAMYTHYMFNTLAVNPAYAGTRDALTVTGLHRSMWVGFDGAPTTQTLTLHTPFLKEVFGLGFSVVNDKIGPSNTTSLALDLAYKLKLNNKFKLSFGVKPSMNLRSVNLASLDLENQNDQAFATNITNQFTGNIGAGLYLYSERFYTGISSPAAIENALYKSSSLSSVGDYKRHFFYIIGGVIDLTPGVKFKPTSFVKVTPDAPIEADLTASFLFDEKFWAGAMFRTGDALGLLLGYNITPQFCIGYSFDWSYANTTFEYNGGSHELMIRYDFIYHNQKQIISPRYF